MEIKYQVFEEDNLLFHRFSGEFSIERYISYMQNLTENLISKPIFKVLVDLRKMTPKDNVFEKSEAFLKKIDEMSNVRKQLNENDFKGREVTLVFWVDKPISTVVAQLFVQKISKANYHYCSTEEKILSILKLPNTFSDLNQMSDNLENTFEG